MKKILKTITKYLLALLPIGGAVAYLLFSQGQTPPSSVLVMASITFPMIVVSAWLFYELELLGKK